jgi:hypothetical protein
MTEKTFSELYCEKHGLKPEEYDAVVLQRALYPHARLLAPLLRFMGDDYFAADLDFVRSVARLRRFREFFYEAEEFAHHPSNRGFWRLTANLRISSRSLRRMVRATLHPELAADADDHTAVPFGGVPAKTADQADTKQSQEAST